MPLEAALVLQLRGNLHETTQKPPQLQDRPTQETSPPPPKDTSQPRASLRKHNESPGPVSHSMILGTCMQQRH
jgi:hypothetical protein